MKVYFLFFLFLSFFVDQKIKAAFTLPVDFDVVEEKDQTYQTQLVFNASGGVPLAPFPIYPPPCAPLSS